jgi:hypothetical protein
VSDDDDAALTDHPVVAALRAPAQPHELAGETAALAMFRRTMPAARRRRRALGRLGVVGGAGVFLGLTLTGGVAAAYTTGLPDPVQDVVHAAIAPLPVPAPPNAELRHLRKRIQQAIAAQRATSVHARGPSHRPVAGRTPQAIVLPTPASAASASQPSGQPTAGASRGTTPSPQPTASGTPAAPRPTLTASVSRQVVPVHAQVVLSGRLARGDAPISGRRVYAAELVAGESGWHRVAHGLTASDGTVSLTVPALTGNVRLRLVTDSGVTSRQLAVAVVPKLAVRVTRAGGQRVATVTADGGRPGDGLVLLRRDGDAWTEIGTTTLADDGTGRFTVAGPGQSAVRYRVRLNKATQHATAIVGFSIPAR